MLMEGGGFGARFGFEEYAKQRCASMSSSIRRQPSMISISGLGFTILQNFQRASEQPSITSISGF